MTFLTSLQHGLDAAAPPAGLKLWDLLAARSDPARYAPRAAPGIEEQPQEENGLDFILLRSPSGAYLRLTPAEHDVWRKMDGSRTVAQLAIEGFRRYKQLLPVGDLVAELRRQGFLADHPTQIYRQLGVSLQQGRVEGWGQRVLQLLAGRQWELPGVDAGLGAIYRTVGWLLFTPLFAAIFLLVALGGLGSFLATLLFGSRQSLALSLSLGGSLPLGLLAFGAMLLLSFVLHECAHGLTVKHFGRRVPRGGVMLYYGLPAAFVDTSDIWPERPLHRIAVSAAGPACDLFVGGLGALLALWLPASALAPFGWRLALGCYGATLFNLNPLLELDGYYILVDLLRLPDLRRRALAYIRGPLWERLRTGELPSGDERVLAVYGLLAAAYLVIAILIALLFWDRQLRLLLGPLWNSGSLSGRLLAVAIVGLVVLPALLGLLFALWHIARGVAAWLLRHGYGRRTGLAAALGVALTALLMLLPARLAPDSPPVLLTSVALWGLALWALWLLREVYSGAALARSVDLQLLSTACALTAALSRLLVSASSPLPLICAGVALALLFAAMLAALPSSGVERAGTGELLATVALLVAAFPLAGAALLLTFQKSPSLGPGLAVLQASPVYLGVLALALALPLVLSMRDSRIVWGRALLWLGALGQLASYLLDLLPGLPPPSARATDIMAAGIWCAAWGVHLLALRQLSFDGLVAPKASASDERTRLLHAFQSCYAGLYLALVAVYGRRRAQTLDDRMDVAAATANWLITLDREHARPTGEVLALGLAEQGGRYAEVLRFTLRLLAELAGDAFARRAIQAAYDALPWPERETADRYVFPSAPWARDLSQQFHSRRDSRLRLLRALDLFIALDDSELEQINAALVEQNVQDGQVVLRAGETPAGIWVVDVGEVTGWHAGAMAEELRHGQIVGSWMLHAPGPSELTFRASIESTLLFLPAALLSPELREQLSGRAADGIETLRLLERVPLFADAPRHSLRALAQQAQRQVFAARTVIVRQGKPSGVLYIIRSGQVAVLVRGEDAPRLVARLGPEEFFGELEYLRRSPPMASVVAASALEALVLPHAALDALLIDDRSLVSGLERVGSGRMLGLRSK